MSPEHRDLLWREMQLAFLTPEALADWLAAYFPAGQGHVGTGSLAERLHALMEKCLAADGMRSLMQGLVDHPPGQNFRGMIWVISLGEIKVSEADDHGLPQVPSHQSWFVANRPFVDRTHLRSQLQQLATSQGAQAVLVIEGSRRSGKSMATALALGIKEENKLRKRINIDDYARMGAECNAYHLAVSIVGHARDCPPFDITKEDQAVPQLVDWVVDRLNHSNRWIILDHCDRNVLTRGARNLLKLLAARFHENDLQGVRMVMADFPRAELPDNLPGLVRYDHAELPDHQHVEEWSRQMAIARNKEFADTAPAAWADEVFKDLDAYDRNDGSWHRAFDLRLKHVDELIRACKERP